MKDIITHMGDGDGMASERRAGSVDFGDSTGHLDKRVGLLTQLMAPAYTEYQAQFVHRSFSTTRLSASRIYSMNIPSVNAFHIFVRFYLMTTSAQVDRRRCGSSDAPSRPKASP